MCDSDLPFGTVNCRTVLRSLNILSPRPQDMIFQRSLKTMQPSMLTLGSPQVAAMRCCTLYLCFGFWCRYHHHSPFGLREFRPLGIRKGRERWERRKYHPGDKCWEGKEQMICLCFILIHFSSIVHPCSL